MSEFNRGKTWNIYGKSGSNISSTASQIKDDVYKDAPFLRSSDSSTNAISFGFVATAILIFMFLIMAIFEHLFRTDASSDDENGNNVMMGSREAIQKPCNQEIMVETPHASVVMPGQRYPTFIAQPAPLPCPREGVDWPFHV